MFLLGKIIASFLLPPGILLILLFISIALALTAHRRAAIALSSGAMVLLLMFSCSPLALALVAPLESAYPPLAGRPEAKAVVVLGNGHLTSSPEFGGNPVLNPEGLARATYGALLSKRLVLPLLYSGGSPGRRAGTVTEAAAARLFWLDLGIDPKTILLEDRSRNTAENAEFTKNLVGKGPVILVTSAMHMPRAMLAFRKAGLQAVAAPTAYKIDGGGPGLLDFLPNPSALVLSSSALHEYLGILWYSLAR